jgi:hypothetical protein
MRQLIGASVELSIGQLLIVEDDGDVVRRALDLLFEQLVDEPVLRIIGLGIVELDQQLLALSGT